MKIRRYLDEDSMDRALIRGLRARGVDVQTALDVNMIERSDQAHLEYAAAQNRALCTFNIRDFSRLHVEYQQEGRSHAGIILVPQQRYSLGDRLRGILKLIASNTAESMRDHVEFLSTWTPE